MKAEYLLLTSTKSTATSWLLLSLLGILTKSKKGITWKIILANFYCSGILKASANGRNIVGQQLPTLLDITCCIRLHTLLHVVGCCYVLLRKVWNRLTFISQQLPATVLPTLLGPRTLITHGLQRLMGCILPTMHCRSQKCWELLHRLHTTANTRATTLNIIGATMLRVVAFVCARSLRMVYKDLGCILPTMHRWSQYCLELLRPFAHHCQHARSL